MRWLIVGAGGIGATYGARLLSVGESVTFVARGAHLEAMQTLGLDVSHATFRFQAPVDAVDEATLLRDRSAEQFDVIVLAFKTQETQAWLERFGDWLGQGSSLILSLQNGVDNEPWIADVVGTARTLGGLAVRIGAHIIEPGVIHVDGEARIVLGPWPNGVKGEVDPYRAQEIGDALERTGIPVVVTQKIDVELWRKLMINVAVNPLSALTQLDTRTLSHDPPYAGAVRSMMEEVRAVGVADGVPLTDRDVEEMYELIRGFEAIKTSMLVDREKGRPLELSGLSGAITRRAERYGIPVPVTALVDGLLRLDPGLEIA